MSEAEPLLAAADVVILAGGLGTRLRDALPGRPKVLAPVGGGLCYLDFLVRWLERQGARRVILSLGHMAGAVTEHLARHPPAQPEIVCVIEDAPLGTAGALRLAARKIRGDVALVLNGDSWTDCDLNAFLDDHRRHDADFSLLCVAVDDAARYGTVLTGSGRVINGFREKTAATGPGLVSAGAYLFGKKALDELAKSAGPSLEKDFFEKRLDLRARAFPVKAAFIDIGTPESLAMAETVFGVKGIPEEG